MDPRSTNAWRLLASVASRSKGIATRRELLAAGLSATQIKSRVRSGALIPEYPGVYRVGHRAPSVEASYLAAVKACGEGAVLSGMAAAYIWGLVPGGPPPPEVSGPTKRRVRGVRTRRRRFAPGETGIRLGIPITSVSVTLVDLAALLPLQALSRACHEAGVRYRTTPRQVASALQSRPNARGAAELRRILAGDEHIVLSRLESKFLEVLRAHDLPLPRTNRVAGGRYVDCRWSAQRLTVELDSFRFHNSRHAWEADRHREREAYARGDQFRRYTWADVFEQPHLMLRELRALLA